MSALPQGGLPTQAISSSTSLFVSNIGHRKVNSSTTNVNRLVPEGEKETDQGYSSDPELFSAFFQNTRRITKLEPEKRASAMPPRSSRNVLTPTINLVVIDGDKSPISPVIQTPEHHQSTSDHRALPRDLHITRTNGKILPPLPIIREGIFPADAPTRTHRSTTPANIRARFESTPQLAYCVSLMRKYPLIASESGSTGTPVLDERERDWLSAIQEDLSAQAHIRGLLSKLVAEFVEVEFMEIATISEVVTLGPVLCRDDYRTLLSCFIQRFDQAPLLHVNMLQGLVQLVQSASPGYLVDDDLVRILASLRMRLESTHTPSRAHVYQLVFAVSKVLEVMVTGEVKGLNRKRDHESLLAVLRNLRSVKDDVFLKFQVDYAHQTLLYLPDDETSWQAFLRYAESIAFGLSAATCVFKLDPMNALAAVEHLRQVAGNAIDVVKFNIDGARALQAAAEGAAQAGGRVYWSNKKEAWFLTLQTAYAFVREGRLVEFNKLVCDAGCRFDINFQRGICQLLGEIAANQLWNTASRRAAIDFLGELYKVEGGKKDVKIQKCVVSILSWVSRMSWPDVGVYASSLLANLQEDEIADIEDNNPLRTCLPQPISFPLLDRVLQIPEVEYDLDRMKFQRLQEPLLPVFIPLHAKATLTTSDTDFFPLMERVQEFLKSDRQVFLLLGDSGSGKSLFCRQLERALWDQYEVGCRIPLFINLPSIDQPDVDLVGKHLCVRNNISFRRAQEIKRNRQLVLICDGYDESRLTSNLHTTNGLNQLDVKMVISCRNTFLSRGYEGRFYPQGSDKYHDSSPRLFEEATIVPFRESDIQEFVTRYVMDPAVAAFLGYAPTPRQDNYLEKLRVIPNVMNLAKNPFLLALALKALPFLSVDVLDQTKLEATQQDLYRGFIKEWIQLNKRRLDRASLRQEVQVVFDELLEADFEWCVRDYSKRLAEAIYFHQKGRPVVEYTHRNDKGSWKMEFFSPDIEPTLLREASPLTKAGIQHWFIHKSLLDYFLSLAIFDPDDSNQGGPGGGGDDDSGGGGGGSHGGGGSSFHDGGGGMVDDGENSTHGYGGGGGSSGGGGGSSDGGSGSSGGNGGSSSGNHDSIGERGNSGEGNDGSNGDGDDSQRHKDNARSKKKHRLDKSRTSTSNDLISKLNLFREPAVMQFLEERARSDARFKKILSTAIEQSKSLVGPSLAAANAITILFKSGERFQDVNLEGVRVPSNYMLDETLELVSFAGSLTGVDLVGDLLALEAHDTAYHKELPTADRTDCAPLSPPHFLQDLLGIGAYGSIYRAIDTRTNQIYAVKSQSTAGLNSRQRAFQAHEARLHGTISGHPNIVTLHRVLEEDGHLHMVLDCGMEGDLFFAITERGGIVGNDQAIKSIFAQITSAVLHCHSRGVFLRDLKPENIIMGQPVKLVDFGLATTEPISSEFGCGSTFYLSPECQGGYVERVTSYDSAANDVWSLGVILINLVFGRNPWKQACPRDETFSAFILNNDFLQTILPMSDELNEIIKSIFCLNPRKRIGLEELRRRVLACSMFTVANVLAPMMTASAATTASTTAAPTPMISAIQLRPDDMLYSSDDKEDSGATINTNPTTVTLEKLRSDLQVALPSLHRERRIIAIENTECPSFPNAGVVYPSDDIELQEILKAYVRAKLRTSFIATLDGNYSFEDIRRHNSNFLEQSSTAIDDDNNSTTDEVDTDDCEPLSLEAEGDYIFIRSSLYKHYQRYNVVMNRNKYMLLKDKIGELVLHYKGNELPGFISFATFTKIYMETLSRWNDITKTHVFNMHQFLYKAITRFIVSSADPLPKYTFLFESDKFYSSQVTKIDDDISDIFADERSPITMNKRFYTNILKKRKASAEQHIHGLVNNMHMQSSTTGEQMKKILQEHLKSFCNISHISDVNYNEQLAVEDLREQLTSYCKVARKRLVDIPPQTIERHVIKRVYLYFDMLIAMDDNTITSHLIESPGKQAPTIPYL
ncbi:hypothetical protein BGZ89_006086 [Linnemannia elongata]|nr:hypothetical protein BGZ89_006086 [Linnemannia elongata]